MKSFFTLLLFLLGVSLASQAQNRNRQFGVGYNLFLPKGDMKEGFNSAHGIGGDILFGLKKAPFIKLGGEAQYSVYGSSTRTQEFAFRDGSTTVTDVNLNSQMWSVGGKARFEHPNNNKRIRPYGQLQGGLMSMSSTVFVEDPHDEDGCKPLDKRTPVKDYGWYAGGGAGMMIDLAGKKGQPGKYFIDISASCLGGSKQQYANMDKVYDANSTEPDKGKSVNVQFVNVSTNEVHEHRVAELYEHKLSVIQAQVRFVYRW